MNTSLSSAREASRPPHGVCPECGRHADAARGFARRPRGVARWLPWALVALVVALQCGLAFAQLRFGWRAFARMDPAVGFTYFVGEEHGYEMAELTSLAALKEPGDQLVGALLRRGSPFAQFESDDGIEVCMDRPKGTQFRVIETGWPLRWKNVSIVRRTDNVFADQASLGDELRGIGYTAPGGPTSWQFEQSGRSNGRTHESIFLTRSARVTLVVVAAGLAWGLAWLMRRVVRPRDRRARLTIRVCSVCVAALAAGLFVWRSQHVVADHFQITPEDATSRPFVPTGLTVGKLRDLLGTPDADARVAAKLIQALPRSGAKGEVLLARRRVAAPNRVAFAEIGWPHRLVYFVDATKPDPAGNGLLLPFHPQPGQWVPQLGAAAWSLPQGPGSAHCIFLALEVGELGLWAVRLLALFWTVRLLTVAACRLRTHRRANRSMCVACGYDLSGTAGASAGIP